MNRVVKHISPATSFRKQFIRQLTSKPLISARKSIFPRKAHCSGKSVKPETCPGRRGEIVFVSFLNTQFTNT